MSALGFFWKFSRDGDWSKTYCSLIINVHSSRLVNHEGGLLWRSSFGEIENLLLLLQDIELFNDKNGQRNGGVRKPAYVSAVSGCGFQSPKTALELRARFVCGQAIMGRHSGSPIDWGFCALVPGDSEVLLEISYFKPRRQVIAATGVADSNDSRDLLSCYRTHSAFQTNAHYWDLMPRHVIMKDLCERLQNDNTERAESFLTKVLNWQRQTLK